MYNYVLLTTILKTGFGWSDVENAVACTADSVMRIASISKALTSLVTARLVDRGVLDLDTPIRTYLPDLSPHLWEGRQVSALVIRGHSSSCAFSDFSIIIHVSCSGRNHAPDAALSSQWHTALL